VIVSTFFTGSDRRTRVPAESCRGRVSSLPISGPRSAFTASLSTKAQYELREPYGLFAVLRQSALLRPVRRCRTHAAPLENATALPYPTYSRYYLEMLRFDWATRRTKAIGIKHGIWFEEAQSVLAIRMDAYFMIRSTPSTRSVHSTWCEFSGRTLIRSSLFTRKTIAWSGLFLPVRRLERRCASMRKEYDFSE